MRKNYFLSLFLLMTAFWHVEATDGNKSTNPAREVETLMLAAPGNPTLLTGLAVGGNSTKINLTWNDNSSDETEFEIAYSTLPTGYQTVLTGSPNSSPTGSFQLTSLLPGTQYYVWVRAVKNGVDVPSCVSVPNMPTNAAPVGKSVSCWSNQLLISTNVNTPESPTGAYVAPISQRTATLNWTDNSTTETSFEILRSGDDGVTYTTIATIPGISGTGNRTYVDNGLFPNSKYSYRVWAINGTGYSTSNTTTAIFPTPPDPPVAPNSLGSFGIGLNSVSLYWINGASNAEAFVIEYSVDNNSWVVAGTNPPYVTGFTVYNLEEGRKYFFRVKATNSGGSSGYSNTAVYTTLKRVAPNPSFNLTAQTVSTTQIDLAWNLGTQDGVTNNRVAQEIYRSSTSATDGFSRIATIGDYESSYSDKTGSPKTKYWYKVLAANYQGQSPFSNVASATTLGPPYAPSDLKAVLANDALGNTIIKASWKDNSDDEWGFALERSLDNSFTNIVKADLIENTVEATSIPFEEGVTYFFRIKASNIYGDSKYSEVAQIETIVTAIPNAPYDLKGTATSASVSLKWGDDSNKESTFDVERSTDGTTFASIGTTGRNEVTYIDNTVSDNTKYYYRVKATNIKGGSDYTNVLAITTLAKTSAAIQLADADIFQVYPNPTTDGIKVSVSDNMLKESGVIMVTDKMNRVISKTLLNTTQSEYNVDLSNYSEGTYTISLRTATQQITKRVYKF
jgi:titin